MLSKKAQHICSRCSWRVGIPRRLNDWAYDRSGCRVHRALLWIDSSLSVWVLFREVCHTGHAYSTTERIMGDVDAEDILIGRTSTLQRGQQIQSQIQLPTRGDRNFHVSALRYIFHARRSHVEMSFQQIIVSFVMMNLINTGWDHATQPTAYQTKLQAAKKDSIL